jgi:hypothetical protein
MRHHHLHAKGINAITGMMSHRLFLNPYRPRTANLIKQLRQAV